MPFFSQIAKFFSAPPDKYQVAGVYVGIVGHARQPRFYTEMGVPDTVDGRFEMILLHMFLLLYRLKQEPHDGNEIFQRMLIECLIEDMDRSLREMGAGDTGVGRRVKAMAGALYGRLHAYEAALASDIALAEALTRNVYGTVRPDAAHVAALAAYVRTMGATLSAHSAETLRRKGMGEV